jgi:predicted deacylase
MLDGYPNDDERERELEDLAKKAGGSIVDIGISVEGRPIRGARIPKAGAPRVLVNANIHGPEWIGSRVAMNVLRALADNPAQLNAEAVVVPCINVDGYARTQAQNGVGTLKELRCNSRGVDLNRNFPKPREESGIGARLAASGSTDPRKATYRGTGPLSEPEAAAMAAFCEREQFHACVSLHSFMGTFIPPCVRTHAHAKAYADLARAMKRAQSNARYHRLAFRFLDVFTGELEDHLHHALGCWSITLECFSLAQSIKQHLRAPSLFWRFNPHDPKIVVENDVPAVFAFLKEALEMPRPSL